MEERDIAEKAANQCIGCGKEVPEVMLIGEWFIVPSRTFGYVNMCKECNEEDKMEHDFQPQFEAIMERFDFEKVQALMKISNWVWATISDENGKSRVPTVDECRSHAYNLFYSVNKADKDRVCNRWGSGGFYWRIYTWDSGKHLELTFDFVHETSF